jgi:hypothetical protein
VPAELARLGGGVAVAGLSVLLLAPGRTLRLAAVGFAAPLAETGTPGLALFGWLLAVPLVLGFRHGSRNFAGRASLIVALVVLAIGVHSLFYDAFFEDPLTWSALGLGALVASWRGDGR